MDIETRLVDALRRADTAEAVAAASAGQIASLTRQIDQQATLIEQKTRIIALPRADSSQTMEIAEADGAETRFLRRQVDELNAEAREHSRFVRGMAAVLVERLASVSDFVEQQHATLTHDLAEEKRGKGTTTPAPSIEHHILISEKYVGQGRTEILCTAGQLSYINRKEAKLRSDRWVTLWKEPCGNPIDLRQFIKTRSNAEIEAHLTRTSRSKKRSREEEIAPTAKRSSSYSSRTAECESALSLRSSSRNRTSLFNFNLISDHTTLSTRSTTRSTTSLEASSDSSLLRQRTLKSPSSSDSKLKRS